jgi:hypothetical protein
MFSACCKSICDYDNTMDLWKCRKCGATVYEFYHGEEGDKDVVPEV